MFPFDRLIRSVDELVASGGMHGEITAQIGEGRYEPRSFPFVRFMDKPVFEKRSADATYLISHAGVGTISMALRDGKPLLVIPRLSRFRESVNDHQLITARKFSELGHVLVAYETSDIPSQFNALRCFQPQARRIQTDRLARRIGALLGSLR